MWNGYFYKIQDSWVPSLFWAPRWFSANGYGTLTDFIETPDLRNESSAGTFDVPTSSVVPSGWVNTTSTALTGSLIQRFFETFVNEREFINSILTATMLTRQMFFDVSEPEYAWIVEVLDPVDTLYVLTSNGSALVQRAHSDLELFYSADWRWKQEKTCVLLYGLDIQHLTDTTEVASVPTDWHYLDALNLSSTGSLVYMEHPYTKNWFPIHPLNIRSDGFTNFYYDGTIRFRAHSPRAKQLLEEVYVNVNGEQKTARRIPLFNSIDEKALYFHLSRRYGETNETLGQTLLNTSWFGGQTHRKLRSFLSAALRQGQIITVAASASSFTIPVTATGFAIRNIDPWVYLTESLQTIEDPSDSSQSYYTMYASGELGCGYLRGVETSFTNVSGYITYNSYTDFVQGNPLIRWKLPYYTSNASTVFLTENFPHEVPSLKIYFASKVDVVRATEASLKRSFNRTSPIFRWSRSSDGAEVLSGLAEFDF